MTQARTLMHACVPVLLMAATACSSLDDRSPVARRLEDVTPWPEESVRCASERGERAEDLAREARATWARVRFDLADGPAAVRRMERAVACAQRSGDLRAQDLWSTERDAWKAEVDALLRRERLSFALAERRGEAEVVALHARRLLALLDVAAGDEAESIRMSLARIERRSRARGSTQEDR